MQPVRVNPCPVAWPSGNGNGALTDESGTVAVEDFGIRRSAVPRAMPPAPASTLPESPLADRLDEREANPHAGGTHGAAAAGSMRKPGLCEMGLMKSADESRHGATNRMRRSQGDAGGTPFAQAGGSNSRPVRAGPPYETGLKMEMLIGWRELLLCDQLPVPLRQMVDRVGQRLGKTRREKPVPLVG